MCIGNKFSEIGQRKTNLLDQFTITYFIDTQITSRAFKNHRNYSVSNLVQIEETSCRHQIAPLGVKA